MEKKILLTILLVLIFVTSCNFEDNMQETTCVKNEELNVNEGSKFYKELLWKWKINNNVLTIQAKTHWEDCEELWRYISFNINKDCLTIIESKEHSCSCDADCINSLEQFSKDLIIKKWDENTGVIGANEDTYFWVDFKEDNKIDY